MDKEWKEIFEKVDKVIEEVKLENRLAE